MERPYLIPIEPSLGAPEALIVVQGSLSQKTPFPEQQDQWWWAIRTLGWQGSIYQLWWDQSRFHLSLESLAQMGIEGIVHWHRYKNYLRRVGKHWLPQLVSELSLSGVSLLGFSLGVRIVYYAMRDWPDHMQPLNSGVLLAGTVRRDRDWSVAISQLTGKLINVYNSEDLILHRFCQMLEWERSPCGLKPILEDHPQLVNFNATALMQTAEYSPLNYLPVLQEMIKQEWWKI
ncbi:DUF726 domain-containing protein [Spirulina sp. CS-785/01]|uniref:DUF726 domain-containing protein n=1 Tax=Spirulina sp. CS-785/01 TaxID=3021716 RepID=UPI00232BFE9E|nr:DUF726 domain-containing protein [Spirulina sp. CS-785/01]MDB9313098.1 DUF726 domain-containing protein [Spirulina sp. CS-785/01]